MLSAAVVEVLNSSSFNITFDVRWTPTSAWTACTESPGQAQVFSTGYSTTLTPQVLYNTTTSSSSQTILTLAQGYGEWSGSGTPPASSAKVYQFQNTSTGVQLTYVAPTTPNPTEAVVEILNSSTHSITFDYRWSPSAAWTVYTESPGQSELFWTGISTSLTPQVRYNTSTSSGSQSTVTLAKGFGQWTGSGTPPVSAAQPYQFLNTSTGVQLVSGNIPPPVPGPTPAPNPATSTNWSGYVAESSLSQPKTGSVTAVSGSWKVPTVVGPSTGSTYSSVWVGIDGAGGSTVEQVGTEEDLINGVPIYRAWWEMYSTVAGQPEQVISSMVVSPGDSITASVLYLTTGEHAGQFLLSITDSSRANDSFSIYKTTAATQNPQALRNCAEWIVEAPTVGNGQSAIANFGSVNFTNASATINGVTGAISSPAWQSLAVNLVSGGVVRDTTSVLNSSGSAFTVSYNASTRNVAQAGSTIGTTTTEPESHRQVAVAGISSRKAHMTDPRVIHGRSARFGTSIDNVSRLHSRPVQAMGSRHND